MTEEMMNEGLRNEESAEVTETAESTTGTMESAELNETTETMETMETTDTTENDGEAMESMESILEQYGEVEELHRGKVVTGTVVEAVDGGWLVDVGYKCEGFLPAREWSHKVLVEDSEGPAVEEKIQVQVVSIRHGEAAQLLVSSWRCEFDRRWSELENKFAQNEVVQVKGLRKVKGGLMVESCGLEGFVPISHLAEEGRGVNPGKFVDDTFDAKLLEKDKKKHRLVFSRRLIVEESLAEEMVKFYTYVQE